MIVSNHITLVVPNMRIILGKDEKVIIGNKNFDGASDLAIANINGRLLSYIEGEVAPDIFESPDYLGFLHRHRKMESMLLLDSDHVVIDRSDWEKVRSSWGIDQICNKLRGE